MRFRQHQGAAQTRTVQLMLWFGVLVVALTLAINLLLALVYKLVVPTGFGFPNLFFETNTAVVVLFVVGGAIIETQRLTRSQFERWFANRAVGLVIMEACGSAHHWARWLNGLGIEVRLNRPGFRGGQLVKVKPGFRCSRRVADSSLPQPRPVEYTQSAPAVGDG